MAISKAEYKKRVHVVDPKILGERLSCC